MRSESIIALLAASLITTGVCASEIGDKPYTHEASRFETVADIHDSPAVLAHPTEIPSGEASIAELGQLRRDWEERRESDGSERGEHEHSYRGAFEGD